MTTACPVVLGVDSSDWFVYHVGPVIPHLFPVIPVDTVLPRKSIDLMFTLTEEGRALQEKTRDVPARAAGCLDLPPDKAKTLYSLLYELLENQKNK